MSMDNTLRYNTPWILQRADPFVTFHDGYYYFTASVPAYDSIVLRRSRTLEGLRDAEEKVLWKKHESGPMSEHIWAPEMHFLFGGWYIYFAGGMKENVWEIRPYVLRCSGGDPYEDPWEEAGPMQCADADEFSFRAFSLDATTFEDGGERYFVWAEKVGVGKQISNLYIAKMESATKLSTVQVLLTTPDYDWERVGFWVNEGPSVIKRGEHIYLTYSASETGAAYCVGMLSTESGKDLLDPLNWKKERYPVLKTDDTKGLYGPGHNSFVKDEAGRDIMVYHCRTEEKIEGNPLYNPNRHAFLMPVKWDGADRPVFSYDNRNSFGK
ncbi:MAG: family 43 glycosylhydrolase [Lachnospiraceae bacterium]|nr:family 43 glycosylhydrolase [Lachnospiraceae bacterium]